MKYYTYSAYNYVQIIEIPKSEIKKMDFALCNQPSETLQSFYNKNQPDILINAGYFNLSDGATIFNYVNEHQTISSDDHIITGMGITDDSSLLFGNVYDKDWKDFISAYPPLVINGTAITITYATELNYKARRTALGYNDSTVFIILVESPGLAFKALQQIALNIGCTYAINLDGGASTKAFVNGKCITKDSYNRPVDNVFAIYLNKTIYRVQMGAFSKYDNAVKLQQQIQKLEDAINAGYKNAYIRKIGNYYKVQVGAFSKRENAVKVLNDLKEKGFSPFITVI